MTADEILLDAEERMDKAIPSSRAVWRASARGEPIPGWSIRCVSRSTAPRRPSSSWPRSARRSPRRSSSGPTTPGTLKDIEKAIIASDLGFNPQNDGRLIRINIPPLSTETRRKMVGRVKELAEEAKIAIRNIRRDANKAADQAEKAKEISEDERDETKESVQDLTKSYEDKVNDLAKGKEVEVMEDA